MHLSNVVVVVVVSYGPAPLLRLLGLDTERIIVPFSSKGVNHVAYLARVAIVMWCATVCITDMPSFSNIIDVSTIGRSFKTDRSRTPSFHVAQYGDDSTGRELILNVNCPIVSGSRTHNLPNSFDRRR